jgi:hypothetical protein
MVAIRKIEEPRDYTGKPKWETSYCWDCFKKEIRGSRLEKMLPFDIF